MNHVRRRNLLSLGFALLVIVGLYGLLPQLGDFHDSLGVLRRTSATYVLGALLVVFGSYFLAAATYCLLALNSLRYGPTLVVELAGLLVNRILPAGLGGLGLNYAYLRAHKHSALQASAVVGLNNGLGFAGHALLVGSLLIWQPQIVSKLHVSHLKLIILVLLVVVFLILLIVALSHQLAGRLQVTINNWRQQLQAVARFYRRRPKQLGAALMTSMLLTAANVGCLWFCCRALQLTLPISDVFVIFTFGIAAGTATPTPGGLGGVEAGTVAGMIAFGADSSTALAVTLLYRLVSFWFGLFVGGAALLSVRRQHLIGHHLSS